MFSTIVRRAKAHIAKRSRYQRLVAEINGLTPRDLADMGADRSNMLYQAHRDYYS